MIVRINKVDLYYESHGFGDPVLLIPGLGSDANTWAPFVQEFSGRYRVVILENRGSGRSAKPEGPYTTGEMAEDAAGLLDHLGIGRAHIIGKSMGGMVAQLIGALYPEKVRSLVLASTLMKHDAYGEEMLDLGRSVAQGAGLFATYRLAFLMSYSREYCMASRSRLAEVEEMMSRLDPEESLRGYLGQSRACSTHDSRALAPRIKAPALVIVGEDDVITPPRASRELAAAIPRSELKVLPHGGHGFWREFSGEVSAAVGEFLSRS